MDLAGANSLEETGDMEVDNEEVQHADDITMDTISVQDMHHIFQVHTQVFTGLCRADWIKRTAPQQVSEDEMIKPAVDMYRLAARLCATTAGSCK